MSKQTILEPLGDRIIVKEIEGGSHEEKTKSGIIIPSTISADKGGGSKKGTVVSVGPGKINDDGKRTPISVKKNDTIFFQWGDEVTIEGVKYFIVREDNVLVVIK